MITYAHTRPLVLEFKTWSLCIGLRLDLLSWVIGAMITLPAKVWPAYGLQIKIPTLILQIEIMTDQGLVRAIRAQKALEQEFPEDSSSTQDEDEE